MRGTANKRSVTYKRDVVGAIAVTEAGLDPPATITVDVATPGEATFGWAEAGTGQDIRHQSDGGEWTVVLDATQPYTVAGLAGVVVGIQVRYFDDTLVGAWSDTQTGTISA